MTLRWPECFVTLLINCAAPVKVSLSVRPSVFTRMRKRELRKDSPEVLHLRILTKHCGALSIVTYVLKPLPQRYRNTPACFCA